MDGRDIGTNVFPDAQFKFFLTATPEERARRRFEQLGGKEQDLSYDEVLQDVRERDYRDTHRELNPLSMAEDAIEIDSTDINEEETINEIYSRITAEH